MQLIEQKLDKEEIMTKVDNDINEKQVDVFLNVFKDSKKAVCNDLSELIRATNSSLYNAYLETGATNGVNMDGFHEWVKGISKDHRSSIIP